MASINFYVLLLVIVAVARLVAAGVVNTNPAPSQTASSTTFVSAVSLLTRQVDHSAYGEEATCAGYDDCCILDFTRVSCADHIQPACNNKNECQPVPPPIAFSYAGIGDQQCVNVLDNNGKNTIYDQFFISHCTGYIDSVELYSGNSCDGSYWNQVNAAGCYYNGGGIGSFKIIAVPDGKRDLEDVQLNDKDLLSTSAYTLLQNVASVTPSAKCFDKETGAYILGCQVERTDTDDDSSTLQCWDPVKELWIPECLIDRSGLPPPGSVVPPAYLIVDLDNDNIDCENPSDEDSTDTTRSCLGVEDNSNNVAFTINPKRAVVAEYAKSDMPTTSLQTGSSLFTKKTALPEGFTSIRSKHINNIDTASSSSRMLPTKAWLGVPPAHITARSKVYTKKTVTPDGTTAGVSFREVKHIKREASKVTTKETVTPDGATADVTFRQVDYNKREVNMTPKVTTKKTATPDGATARVTFRV